MEKYKVHFIDGENYHETMARAIINEEQKMLLDFMALKNILPEWLKVEYIPEENEYENLT